MRKIYPGNPFPFGPTHDKDGVNFALYSEHATAVSIELFDENQKFTESIPVTERTHNIWHVYIEGLKPGQLYGYRVDGPYEPENGHRFNKNKLLIDPYAKAINGIIEWDDALFGYKVGDESPDLSFSESDSAPFIPKCVITASEFNWEGDTSPEVPYHTTIIYEAHVRGFTKQLEEIPENIRGTYSAIGHPASIEYLKKLGITTLELMPVHQFVADRHLREKGLTNYWGYNTIGFFAPDVRYAAPGKPGDQVNEFKNMIKALHKAGIEVILDVVYNHTAEGNEFGPTLSFKGIDNSSWYRLAEQKRYYMDYTGTGNTLNANLPNVLRMMMDSLRYWILEMHVDGFRFDLASTLARELHEVNRLSAFFDIIHQDPVISQVKLIAEPWDVGEGGYQVGKFPHEWAEWNGKYRDCIRDYWRGSESMIGEFAARFMGSPDLYQGDDRSPTASINFISAHDGFTLQDLVSYNEKHNDANGENNNDGDNNNRSWNCGEEGETSSPEIIALRQQQKRNFLTTLFLSQGIPMLVSGDELGRTQKGNNNAYCQDNEISWLDWKNADQETLTFTRSLIKFRKEHPTFSRKRWFQGKKIRGVPDISWFLPEGSEMTEENWNTGYAKSLALFLNGSVLPPNSAKSGPGHDDTFYIVFNSHDQSLNYRLPGGEHGKEWRVVIDTHSARISEASEAIKAGEEVCAGARSILVLKQLTG